MYHRMYNTYKTPRSSTGSRNRDTDTQPFDETLLTMYGETGLKLVSQPMAAMCTVQ